MSSTLLGCLGCRTVDDRQRREVEPPLQRGCRVLQRLLRLRPSMDQDSNVCCCLLSRRPIVSCLVIVDGLSRLLPVSARFVCRLHGRTGYRSIPCWQCLGSPIIGEAFGQDLLASREDLLLLACLCRWASET